MSTTTTTTAPTSTLPLPNLPTPVLELEKEVVAGKVDTLESNTRYLAYLGRFRPVLIASSRYLAYASDVGESARPLVHSNWVKGAYGVSWLYLIGDVGYEGYKSKLQAQKYCPESQSTVVGLGLAKRAIFQSTASMLLPSLTIHSIVRYTALSLTKLTTNGGYGKKYLIPSVFMKRWLPSILGLGFIPALPFLFDEPVEKGVEWGFEKIEEKFFENQPEIRKALRSEHLKEE